MGEPLNLTLGVVVCRTSGCRGEGEPLRVPIGDQVICGACSQPITDITKDPS